MELRKLYKQTEFGVIPEDWDIVSIAESVIKVGSGITPKGGSSVYKKSGRSFVRSQNVGWGELKLSDIAFIDEETHASFSSSEIIQKDVLLNITGASIGRCALATLAIAGGNVNQHVCIIRTNNKLLDADYLCRVLLSDIGQIQIESFQAGGNREGLNFGQIKSFKIPRPPSKVEQLAIANALSDTDAWIQSLTRLIAKKRQIKQGFMQTMLTGKKRLPEFVSSKNYKQTEIGVIPEDWAIDVIKHHCSITTGDKNTQDRIENGMYPFFVRSQTIERINSYSFDGEAVLTAGDGVGTGKIYHYINGRFDFHQRVYKMSHFSEKLDGYFFYLYFSNNFHSRISQMTAKSSVDSVRMEMIADMKIPLPSTKSEQTAIAKIFSDMDNEITVLEGKLTKAQQIKLGMMQNLLTGRIRLK